MIVVQRVVTQWTKQSRGGAPATRRNAVPEAFPVPSTGRSAVLVHAVEARERDGFAPYDTVESLDRLPDIDWPQLMESWESSGLGRDQSAELSFGVAGVNRKTRDAMAVCQSVTPVTSGVFLLELDDRLRVIVSPPNARSPRYGPREMFSLEPGQWARWRFNGRFTANGCCEGHHWWYEKWVVNVAYMDDMPSAEIFTQTSPARIVDDLVRLF